MSRGSSQARWPLLAVATLLLLSMCSIDATAAVDDPFAQFRVTKLHGRVYVGPGVCGITLDCGPGYVDEVAGVLATPGSPRTPVKFTNDTSLVCTDTLPPNPKANYTCSLVANNATCAGNGETCRCNDLCAAGPLCNWRRTQYKFEASHVVFNGTHNVRLSLGIKSGYCSALTDNYRQTVADYDNHVLLAQKSGYELSYAPEPCSQFGPRGCAQFNTRWHEYKCFSGGNSAVLAGNVLGPSWTSTDTELSLPFMHELVYSSTGNYLMPPTVSPRIKRDLPRLQVCIPRETYGNLAQSWVGCTQNGCDNGAVCNTETTKCVNCPLNYTYPDAYCRTNPCQNGGILSVKTERRANYLPASEVVTFPVCTCPPEWTGYGCEFKNQCLNGGTIYPTATWNIGSTDPAPTNACICTGKFFGDKCQNVCPIRMGVKPCYPITTNCPAACSQNIGCANGGCSNGGTCDEATGACTACKSGWHGQYCEISCVDTYHPTLCPAHDLDEYIDQQNNIKYPGGIPGITLKATLVSTDNYVASPMWNDNSKITPINCNRLDPNATQVGNKCKCSDPCLMGLACNIRKSLYFVEAPRFPIKSTFMLGNKVTSNDAELRKLTSFNTTHFKNFNCRMADQVDLYSKIRVENKLAAIQPTTPLINAVAIVHNPCYQYGSSGCGAGFTCQWANYGEQLNVTVPFTTTTQIIRPFLDGVCCRYGYGGPGCRTFNGCAGVPCLNGGRCLTTVFGKALPLAETKCFGCKAGVNGTAGWTGTFCEIPLDPTYTTVKVSTLPGAARRLLQSSEEDTYISVRASFTRSSDKGGKLYREPARACDCNVQWQPGVVEDLTSANPGKPIVKFGNYAQWSHSADAVMLSPMRFEANSLIQPVWRRKVSSHAEAQYQTSVDFGFGGYYAEDPDVNGNFYVSYWYDNTRPRVLEGLTRTAPYSAHYVYTSMFGRTGTVRLTRYDLNRAPDRSKCASMAFDPVFYYSKYSQQCESVRVMGGIGNLRLPNNTVIATETLAYLHFHFFGHRVRNQPNANCDLTGDWAEDETGCVNKLRYPKAFYPLAANETLTAAICGNVSRIEPARVAFGKALKPGATGTNVTDDGQDMCKCFPPFRAADEVAQVDCSYDLCGAVDKRGLVNASHAGYFTQQATPEACVCQGIWGTDPDTCIGNKCEWCAATVCHNGGTANGTDYYAGCQCAPIFNGTLCENNLCNSTNSFPHNASLWEDRILEQIVCDCRPGWTGTLCNDKQCVHGSFNRYTEKCDCFEGWNAGAQGICDESKCIPSHGLWNNNTHSCDCEHPWRGDSCEIDMCDDYNSVLAIPGWDGMRPFGKSVISQVDGLWTCKCNWPYMAMNRTNDGEFDDRSWDCKANDCGHGIPTPNRNWLNRTTTKKTLVNGAMVDKVVPVDPVPSEACTCRDPYGIGILTDPTRCVGLSHAECPNACLQATCQLTAEKIELIGGYVPVASSDPSCCMCPASAMFHSTGTCQRFCRFYQPCLTTDKSSFARNPNYTADPFAYDDIERELDPDSQEYVCKCNAYYSSITPDMNDCSNYTFLATDPHVNLTGNGYNDNSGDDDSTNPSSGKSSGGGGLSATEQALAIGLSVGAVVLVGLVQTASTWMPKFTQEIAEKMASKATDKIMDPPQTTSSSSSKLGTGAALQLSLLALVCLLAVGVQSAESTHPLDSDWWAKPPSTSRVGGMDYAPLKWDFQTCRNTHAHTGWIATGDFRTIEKMCNVSIIPDTLRQTYVTEYGYQPEVEFDLSGMPGGFPDIMEWNIEGLVGRFGAFIQGTDVSSSSFSAPTIVVWYDKEYHEEGRGTVAKCTDEMLESTHGFAKYNTSLPIRPTDVVAGVTRTRDLLRERNCRFNRNAVFTTHRVGAAMVSSFYLTWSMYQYKDSPNDRFWDHAVTYYALNICDVRTEFRLSCGQFGECINRPAYAVTTAAGFRSHSDETMVKETFIANKVESFSLNGDYHVRGCKCNNGYRGLRCEEVCNPGAKPTGSDSTLCSGKGTCDTGEMITDSITFRTCMCKGGCRCNRGYTGARCEQAVQSKELYIFGDRTDLALTQINACCPDGVTDCSMRTNAYTSNADMIAVLPLKPCPGPIGSSCTATTDSFVTVNGDTVSGFSDHAKISRHLTAKEEAQIGRDPCGQFAPLHGYEGVGNNGRGQCWAGIDSPTTLVSSTFCWCNPDQPEYQKMYRTGPNNVAYVDATTQPSMIPRRGFYGDNCRLRTCTSRFEPNINVPDRLGNPLVLVVKAPLVDGYAKQCSGHSSGQWNGNSTNYYDRLQPCEDKAIRTKDPATGKLTFANVNTDGRCKGCEHGWGLVPGYHVAALSGTKYPEYQSSWAKESYGSDPGGDQGVCAEKTYHTIGGNACGGYYSALIDARNNTLPGLTGSKQVLYVGGCDCGPKEWGLTVPPNSGGICQRTCAGNTSVAVIPIDFFDYTGAFKSNEDWSILIAPDPPRCGGYKQGICRPINNHGYDGWNSACLCNAGYNGPECAKDETMWKNGKVCGDDAEPYMPERPAGATKYSNFMDEDFFHRSIVPLQREGLLSKTAYSGHKCRCKDYAVAAGWEMDGNFCGPSCDTLRSPLFGNLICSGAAQGTCISSPYPGAVGKVCQCAKGWAGEKCDIQILTDKLGRQCGGSDRGKIVFKDAFNMTQRCDCVAPFVPNPIAGEMNGTCWADCPVNPITKQKCTGEDQGACTLDLMNDGLNGKGTKNDNICKCTEGAYEGKDCSTKLVAVYTTQSGRVMPCTGHGSPDPDRNGFCRCDPGWIGFACEIYSPNRQCGTGQTFLDHEALGYNVL